MNRAPDLPVANTFDTAAIQALRLILGIERERYDLGFVMNRWAVIVRNETLQKDKSTDDEPTDDEPTDDEPTDDEPNDDEPTIENLDELVAKLLCAPPGTTFPEEDDPAPRRQRRERVDGERWAALLLAVIFNEYTKAKPTRISKNHDAVRETYARDKTSPFYRFATAAFEAIGLKVSESAFREATERWERSRKFQKRNIQQLLWGRLTKRGDDQRAMFWSEKPPYPCKNSPKQED